MIGRDSQLAWLLADELVPHLAEPDKISVYVELGSGDIWTAITQMLTVAARDELPLPTVLIDDFAMWLDKYVGGIEEPLIRDLLLRVHGGSCGDDPAAGDDRSRETGTGG